MTNARELLAELPSDAAAAIRTLEWLDDVEPTGEEPYSLRRLCQSIGIDYVSVTAPYVILAYVRRQAPARWLRCAFCGEETWGRQWPNRDHGYGMCTRCGDWHRDRYGEGSLITYRAFPLACTATHMGGVRGIHWDIPYGKVTP